MTSGNLPMAVHPPSGASLRRTTAENLHPTHEVLSLDRESTILGDLTVRVGRLPMATAIGLRLRRMDPETTGPEIAGRATMVSPRHRFIQVQADTKAPTGPTAPTAREEAASTFSAS